MSYLATARALLGLPLAPSRVSLGTAARAVTVSTISGPPRATSGTSRRLTVESAFQQRGFTGGMEILVAPDEPNAMWATLDVTPEMLRRLPASRVIEILVELSPDVSRALWDFIRLCNPGWSVKAVEPETARPHKAGQAALDAFVKLLRDKHGSEDVPINKMFFGAYLRGAILAEVVLDTEGYFPLDLATPDPAIARFQQVDDPQEGTVWQLGQLAYGRFEQINSPRVRYLPIDPWPGSPYGRSPVVPAIFASLFLLSLLHDMKRVISQQGYPRLDISVNLEELRKSAPPMILGDPAAWSTWVHDVVDEVKDTYANLQPDDALVHTSTVEVNGAVGAVDADSLGAFTGIIAMLESMLTRALKTMPLLMSGGGNSEASSNRQWEIEATGRRSMQRMVEACLNYLGTLVLQAQGLPAEAKFEFVELRAAERFRDAQTDAIEIENAYTRYWLGLITFEELSMKLTGNLPAEKQPLQPLVAPGLLGTAAKPQGAGNGSPDNKATADSKDPSANRALALVE